MAELINHTTKCMHCDKGTKPSSVTPQLAAVQAISPFNNAPGTSVRHKTFDPSQAPTRTA